MNDFFYFNHFLLIIFYHSVWLGFELFGLRAQVYSQLVQFMIARKEYDNHHCHNNIEYDNHHCPDRKWDWSVYDVMPGRDDLENLRILKKRVSWKVDLGPWRQRVEFSIIEAWSWIWAIEDVVGVFGSLTTEILNITRCAARWDSVR